MIRGEPVCREGEAVWGDGEAVLGRGGGMNVYMEGI